MGAECLGALRVTPLGLGLETKFTLTVGYIFLLKTHLSSLKSPPASRNESKVEQELYFMHGQPRGQRSPVPVLPSTSGKVISPDPRLASVTGLRLASVTRFVSWSSKPPVASSLGEASFLTTAGDTVVS